MTETTDETMMTAGQLARRLERSGYGVKKALQRMGIPPVRMGGTSYYPSSVLDALGKAMRSPNRQPV